MLNIPSKFESVRALAQKTIHPICPINNKTNYDGNFWIHSQRTRAGNGLPEYYLVYFLLVELLGFENLGQWEKIAWTVPIDYMGQSFLISHRKFGIGVFAHDSKAEEDQAKEIVGLIRRGVKVAEPFFIWRAEQAVKESKINVVNKSDILFERYEYFLKSFKEFSNEAKERANEKQIETQEFNGGSETSIYIPSLEIREKAKWQAIAAIDAFFSWTEHIFIHIAILTGKIISGEQVAELAEANWKEKFKCALDTEDPKLKLFYDELIQIRRQLRNYMAHGAFGKRGQAFDFHSGAGAVPVMLTHKPGQDKFTFASPFGFEETKAIEIIEKFISHLWSGKREPARLYIQESGLPLILPMATDGTYERVMRSLNAMNEFVDGLALYFDRSRDMDW